jgi:helix-hairpin-helix protein
MVDTIPRIIKMSKPSYFGTTSDSDSFRRVSNKDLLHSDSDARTDAKVESKDQNIVKLKSGKKVDKTSTVYSGILMEVVFGGTNHFVVVKIDNATCKGRIAEPSIGASYSLVGKFVYDERYRDWNFQFDSYEVKIDAERGLVQYLAREAPGLGPKTASQLVKLHGFRVMELLRGDDAVPGLSPKQHSELRKWARREGSNASIKERLYSIGLTPSQVKKLLDHYGPDCESKIRRDCFSLTEIHGFGFKTVSAIANLIGIPTHDSGRIKAAIMYATDYLTQNDGHVYLSVQQVVSEACALLSLGQGVVVPVIVDMLEKGELLVHEKVKFKDYADEHGILLV